MKYVYDFVPWPDVKPVTGIDGDSEVYVESVKGHLDKIQSLRIIKDETTNKGVLVISTVTEKD